MYKSTSRFIQRQSDRAAASDPKEKEEKTPPKIPRRLKRALNSSTVTQGRIVERVKGGYKIDLDGFSAFCPFSQMYPRPLPEYWLPNFGILRKQTLEFIVIEVGLNSVIVSRRKAARRTALEAIKEALSKGTVLPGTVRDVQPFGAFVDLGGMDGLLHISEITGGWVDDIHKFVRRGQAVEVVVLSLSGDDKRVSLSLRRVSRAGRKTDPLL